MFFDSANLRIPFGFEVNFLFQGVDRLLHRDNGMLQKLARTLHTPSGDSCRNDLRFHAEKVLSKRKGS